MPAAASSSDGATYQYTMRRVFGLTAGTTNIQIWNRITGSPSTIAM